MSRVPDRTRGKHGRTPAPAVRWLYRAPICIFRAGLAGWMRYVIVEWILITTRGRRTGRPHSVLVDLLARDPGSGALYVQSAYGRRSDWVRNVEATPEVEVRLRGRDVEARVSPVPREEALRAIEGYIAAHPVYSRLIAWFLGYRGELVSSTALRDWLAGNFMTFVIVPLETP